MSIPEQFSALEGRWTGVNRLHAGWLPDPVLESEATADLTKRLGDQFLEVAYTWVYEEKLREGLIILTKETRTNGIVAFWSDSWHLAHQLMECTGTIDDAGVISVFGTYKVEGHPDWGWRTVLKVDGEAFRYEMYNVSPEGEEEIAVEMDFQRV